MKHQSKKNINLLNIKTILFVLLRFGVFKHIEDAKEEKNPWPFQEMSKKSIMLRSDWKILLEDTHHLNATLLYNFMRVVLYKLF